MDSYHVTLHAFDSMKNAVSQYRIKDIRKIFSLIRQNQANCNYFLPLYGLCIGNFATCYTLNQPNRKTNGGGMVETY